MWLTDRSKDRLRSIERRTLPAEEPALLEQLRAGMEQSLITATDALITSEEPIVYIVCVPTPASDLRNLDETVLAIAKHAKQDDTVLIRSTVPIGTARRLRQNVHHQLNKTLLIAAAPDRSVEGRTYLDQFEVPHLVGGMDPVSTASARDLLGVLGKVIEFEAPEYAEAAKIFCNCWRTATFAMANAMTLVADDHNLDVHTLLSRTQEDYPRFGVPRPGIVGGPCLPKDLDLLVRSERAASMPLFEGVRASEEEVQRRITAVAAEHLRKWEGARPKIGILGLSFKGLPAVSDVRGSPSISLAQQLVAVRPDAEITGWNPGQAESHIEGVSIRQRSDDVIADCALLILGHEHPDVIGQDLSGLPDGSLVLDLTGLAGVHRVRNSRTRYWGLGRKNG